MSTGPNTTQNRDLGELREHLKWLDEERRKTSRKVADLEQRLALQGRDLAERDKKIQDLEWQITSYAEHFELLPDLESHATQVEQRLQDLEWQLANLNSQVVLLPKPEDERARQAEEVAGALAGYRDQIAVELSAVENRLQENMASLLDSEAVTPVISRQNEQAQTMEDLAGTITELGERITVVSNQLNEQSTGLTHEVRQIVDVALGERLERFSEENQAQITQHLAGIANSQRVWESKWTQLEEGIATSAGLKDVMPLMQRLEQELDLRQSEESRLVQQMDELENRIAQTSDSLVRVNDAAAVTEASVKAWTGDQLELRELVTSLSEKLNRDQDELDQKLVSWQVSLDEHKDTIDQFAQQWLSLSNQYKEARMAVQNFAHWQKQLEQQKRDSTEMLRAETSRMQSQWDSTLQEIQERLREFELDFAHKWQALEFDHHQKWAASSRNEQAWQDHLSRVENLIRKVQIDSRDFVLRVQAAQVDAIRRWPTLLSEEVERVMEHSPHRPLTPVAAEPHSSLSVIDAIEQGLISVDYESESDGEP